MTIPKQTRDKKVFKLYLTVFFFFALFSFGEKISADTYTEITPQIGGSPEFYIQNIPDYCQPTPVTYKPEFTQYAGNYPDTSTPVQTYNFPSLGTNCNSLAGDGNIALSNASPWTTGYYWYEIHSDDTPGTHYYSILYYDGVTVEDGSDTSTRIISHDPGNNEVLNPATPPYSATSTNPVAVSIDIYFNDVEDINLLDRVCLYMEPMEVEMNYSPVTVCKPIIASAGSTILFDTQNLSHGRYFALAYFSNGDGSHFFTQAWEFINQYTLVQNQSCAFGDYVNGTCPNAQAPEGYASTTPVAFNGIPLDDCSIEADLPTKALCAIGNTFKNTINFLFIPDTFVFNEFTTSIHDDMLTHFPLGYITDFVEIISTSTVGTLTVLDATVPPNMLGAGATLTLDLNHGLDPYLNATSGAFKSGTATSTETLFEFTNRYWTIIVYIFALLYIIKRIFGWWNSNQEIT